MELTAPAWSVAEPSGAGKVTIKQTKVAPPVPKAPSGESKPVGPNLVRNPGFEENAEGLPAGWEVFDYFPNLPTHSGSCSVDSKVAHTGKCSVQIPPVQSYMDKSRANGCFQQIADRGGGKTFLVSAWVKASPRPPLKYESYYRQQEMTLSETTRVRIFLYGYRPGGGWEYAGAASPIFQVGTDWQKITHQVIFPPDITKVNLVLMRPFQIGLAQVWFDDVEVREIKP